MKGESQQIQTTWTQLELTRLTRDPRSPRRRQRRSVSEIVRSIREFGFIQPIVVDEEHTIIVGHGRFEAAKRLELATVPVVVLTGLSDPQRSRLQIADNRLAGLSDWDEGRLIEQMERLYDTERTEIPGFSTEEVDEILGALDISHASRELPPQREALPERSELHLLVSCRAASLDRMAELVASLRSESWCSLEQGAL
jgi:ParB/RepB/Spo0J family partition protein